MPRARSELGRALAAYNPLFRLMEAEETEGAFTYFFRRDEGRRHLLIVRKEPTPEGIYMFMAFDREAGDAAKRLAEENGKKLEEVDYGEFTVYLAFPESHRRLTINSAEGKIKL